MTKILIIGGAGMVGQKLAERIASGTIDLDVSALVLHDVVPSAVPEAPFPVTVEVERSRT